MHHNNSTLLLSSSQALEKQKVELFGKKMKCLFSCGVTPLFYFHWVSI